MAAPPVAEPGASVQSLEQLDAEKAELRKKLDEATQKVEVKYLFYKA